METPIHVIIERLNHTLEYVIAPHVRDPMVRGQLFAVIELLNQLPGRFEFRHDFLVQDIQRGKQILAGLIESFGGAGLAIPAEITAAAETVDLSGRSGDQLREERSRTESAVSLALDMLDTHRSSVPGVERVEKAVLDHLAQGVLRDLGLFRPKRFDKISQRVQEE